MIYGLIGVAGIATALLGFGGALQAIYERKSARAAIIVAFVGWLIAGAMMLYTMFVL